MKCARSRFDVPGTPGAARPQISRAGECSLIIVFMRHWECRFVRPIHALRRAPNRPTTTTQHHGQSAGPGERTWLRQPSKEFVVDCVARGETAGSPSQKLPSTAIYCHELAATPLRPFQPLHSLPSRGHAGRPVIGHCLSVIGHWFLGTHSSGWSRSPPDLGKIAKPWRRTCFPAKAHSPQELANARGRAARVLAYAVRHNLRHGQWGAHFRPDS